MTKPSRYFGSLLTSAVTLIGLSSLAGAQQRPSGEIRVRTELVNVLASVSDKDGHPIPNLTQDAFELTEEDVPQKIERFESETNRPLDLALMVDSSMSTFKDLHFEIEAAAHFIGQVVRPSDYLGVFSFSDSVSELSAFSNDVPRLQDAAHSIAPGSGTSIYDAVVLGSNALRRRPPDRRRAIVLVTDAGETTSVSKFEDARRAAILSGTLLYAVVIRPIKSESGRNTAGEHALITIMDSTGGGMFILDSLDQLESIFDRINRELRTQYLISYYPQPQPPAGSDRHIGLTVKGGDYTLSYRKEYFATSAP